jgi:uncharacterized protein YbjQ (UPF0145 family)
MPFFHHKSEEEKQQEEEQARHRAQEDQDRQLSLDALARGGIPIQAQRRLDELRNRGNSFFTSDLTVNEFALSRQSGFRPLSQVMGSSIYHVGWQYMPSSSFRAWAASQELEVVTKAMNHARELALGRLAEEARRVGADAVIGVHVKRANYDWAGDLIEFNTVGTAVKLNDQPPAEHPGLTNLSGQDFWKLYSSGYWPLGVVAGSTVFYVVAGWQTQMANNSFWARYANQELTDFSHGLQRARHLAMGRIHQQSNHLGAHGVVGVEIEQDQEEHEVDLGNDQERTDMIFTFHAIGTAISAVRDMAKIPPIHAALNLRAEA